MPKRNSTPQSDPKHVAHRLQANVTGELEAPEKLPTPEERKVMAEMGRRGGLKGGKRSLETMTTEERKARAKKAARARWKKDSEKEAD